MKEIVVIAGPTAVGKTEYAIGLANTINGEIISCDSMQLYKYMDIGSAKPTEEQLKQCPHHLINQIDPREDFSVARYQKLAFEAINQVENAHRIPIICGGTGLYLDSILYNMDFSGTAKDQVLRDRLYRIAQEKGNIALHNMLNDLDKNKAETIHPNNVKKIIRAIEAISLGTGIPNYKDNLKKNEDIKPILICLNRDRQELYDRINLRVDNLISLGLIDEVKKLKAMGLNYNSISMKGIGYKEIIGFLNKEYDLDFAIELIKKNTRHYAKRQLTWFKKYDEMKWFNLSEYNNDDEVIKDICKWIEENR